ncbi:hypothetical protein AA0313_2811 [Acetobacter indonesiensis NRIC 0313]|uniref:Uncharacterized protein n=1 Tax=Acetobacter indonesiensis TaxID=104101 RepID=A0A6N3T7F6_9PROT|nr:hypothetical protein Abin_024_052 [Acetobacter indonesiensis]GBQ61775.1 hypothetical protein AA0313_2811 [Acetobacter indonesiensis NRIC 0313]GEN03904.1 hypothetical protein AIN02nite_19290 [Acetobacter indonesiensis]
MTIEELPKSPWARPCIIELASGENPFFPFPREQSAHFDVLRSKAGLTSFCVLSDQRSDQSLKQNTPPEDSQ